MRYKGIIIIKNYSYVIAVFFGDRNAIEVVTNRIVESEVVINSKVVNLVRVNPE